MKYLASIAFLFYSSFSYASINADSLKIAARQQRDSTLSDTYYLLARYYFQVEHVPDSMIKYAALASEVASQYELTSRIMMSKKALGLAYTEARKFELAEKAYAEAMEIAKKTQNSVEIIAINNKLGYLFGVANDLTKSAFYYLNTAKEFEQLKDYRNLANTYINVVVIFTLQNQFDKIIVYTDKALALIPKLNQKTDAEMIVNVYSNAAQHYFLIGERQKNQLLLDKALLYADSCLQTAMRYNVTSGLSDAYYIKGYDKLQNGDFKDAISNLRKALTYRQSIPERSIFNIYSAMAQANMKMSDFQNSEKYLDSCRALTSSKQLDGPMMIAEIEYQLFKKMKRDGAALDAYERFAKLREQLLNNDRNKAINDLEVKYQTELKEAKITELNQQTKIDSLQIRSLIAVVGFVSLVVIVIIFLYRQSLIKSKLNTMEVEQRLNRARMNPHFFFNSFVALQNYALQGTDGLQMVSKLSQFSAVMRKTLESTYEDEIVLREEIDFLNQYFAIQKMRFPATFKFSVTHDPNLDIDSLLIPTMLIQPFVENSLEHGLIDMAENGMVTIQMVERNDELIVYIEDNGKGLAQKQIEKGEYVSRATQITKDRLYLLSLKHKSNARFQMESISTGGVRVSLFLPLNYLHENTLS
jgi:tetratricopeptide (TPR) repeat protein/anti-sigma regulatory factor (Ser/Thr protein kinase)